VPKNLLYLTDKLPKPTYESNTRRSHSKLSPLAKSTSRKANNTIQDEGSMPVITKSSSQSRLPKNSIKVNKNLSSNKIDEVSEPSVNNPVSRQQLRKANNKSRHSKNNELTNEKDEKRSDAPELNKKAS
jgi:hypothetical protein